MKASKQKTFNQGYLDSNWSMEEKIDLVLDQNREKFP